MFNSSMFKAVLVVALGAAVIAGAPMLGAMLTFAVTLWAVYQVFEVMAQEEIRRERRKAAKLAAQQATSFTPPSNT